LSKFRQMVFGRLYSEYHSAKLSGESGMKCFLKFWSNFRIFTIKNDQIDIKL
jgi:hypothetical protein